MADYRFQLQKYRSGSKTRCPHCGRPKCFTRFIDTEGVIELPDHVGICDHANSCGYRYSPSDLFRDDPDMKSKLRDDSHLASATPNRQGPVALPPKPSFIPASIMEATLKGYGQNPLYKWLKGKYGEDAVARAFASYKVGTANLFGGSTVYWQIDSGGNIRTGKVMAYDSNTGKRIKDSGDAVFFVHRLHSIRQITPDFHLKQCFFGEHLLASSPYSQVCIVESEKTALVASICMPGYVWIATGGKDGCFNADAAKALVGRKVTLFPDLGQYDYWSTRKMSLLTPVCKSVACSDMLEKMATAEQRKQGLDIADFLLREDTAHDILQRLIKANPALQLLIDRLDLVLVE